ncbi:MAG TPA: sigma 54-interacting transcriptional regulator [Polyangiaceae bacterium]
MARDPKDITTLQSAREGAAPAGREPFYLWIVSSPDLERVGCRLELSYDEVVAFGRDPGTNGVALNDPRSSRLHGRITYDAVARAFRFGDAQSSNGSYHNGQPVETALLGSGDVLRLGDTLLVFESAAPVVELDDTVSRVAASNLTVLVTGESGTGKELIAKRIHELSGRKGPFVAVNCAALPRDLVASELFGHTRGAFSNATHARAGLFMAAHDGTLLLDEIGDLPPEQQPALLRVLQEHTVRAVGADREIATNARVVVATHVDLAERVGEGAFRTDLFARIAQCVVRAPALRERRREILPLARLFAERAGRELTVSADAAERLVLWHWPFNVRELEAMIDTICVLQSDPRLDIQYLRNKHPALLDAAPRASPGAGDATRSSRRAELDRLLAEHSGNISAVARALGKPRAQIYRWLRRYGFELPVAGRNNPKP